jgi:RecA/RadA recombinase
VAKLRAKTPTNETVTKPKVLIFGPPGCGKTWTALEFPRVYYIDTEGGASLPHYQERLRKAGGVYLGKEDGSNDFREVIREVQSLATTPHDYLTLVIDSFSKLYNLASAQAELAVGNDYGRDRKEANKPTRQLMTWLERLDMNVVLVCHERDKWVREGGELKSGGKTFDGYDKLEYDLHLALHVHRPRGAKGSVATVHKTRLKGFQQDAVFPWSFEEFEKRAGHGVMLRPPQPVELATPEQVEQVTNLLGVVKVDDDWEQKALGKAEVERWADMDREKIQKCIDFLASRGRGKDGGQ